MFFETLTNFFDANFRSDALSDIVEYNGNHYYVDSCNTPDCGFETMVFACDEKGNVTDWLDLHCERYCTREEMETRHKEIVANLGEVLRAEEEEE